MLITDKNIDIWYKEYRDQYARSTKYIKSRKGITRGLPELSRKEFEMDFKSAARDKDNLKKSGTQIAKSMAKQEVFGLSFKQARAASEAHIEKFGGTLTTEFINEYRLQKVKDIFPLISARGKELKKLGKASDEIALIIGQEFFGSK